MSDKPERKFWQFHLLTLMLMLIMVVASGLLGANVLVFQRQPIKDWR